MSWQERVAYQFIKPRKSKLTRTLLLGVAALLVAWGLIVCAAIGAGYVTALLFTR